MKGKIYSSDIIMVLFFHISFITLPYLQSYNLMKYGIIAVTAVFLLSKFKLIFRKGYRQVNVVLLLFLMIVLITSFINRNNIESRDVWLAAIVYCAIILEGFLLFQYYEYKNRSKKIVEIMYYLTLFYIIITDLLLFMKHDLFIQSQGYYFIGNKFVVVYIHLLLIALYWQIKMNNNLKVVLANKLVLALIFCVTVYVSAYIGSASGVVGAIFLFIFIISRKRIANVISKPIISIITLLISCSFLFSLDAILSSSFMKFIIEDVLGKDTTLTGRMRIYDNVFSIIPGHLWTGYGHGSTYEICTKLLGAPNTQNGLLEILVQYGVFGLVAVISLIYVCFKKVKISNDVFPIIAMLYVYIFLASIEITISLQFFLLLAVLTVYFAKEPNNIKKSLEDYNARAD